MITVIYSGRHRRPKIAVIEEDGTSERARERWRAGQGREEEGAEGVRRGGRDNAGAGWPRCEKGSVVSASRFRPVIGSDSVLTLNARARSPALVRRRIEGKSGGKEGTDFRDGRCHPTLHSPPRPLIDNIRSCMILLRVSQWPSGQARSTSIYVPGALNYRRPDSAVDNE